MQIFIAFYYRFFTLNKFNNKKVIVESENSDKILFINGKVIYDGMKFYRFFEEIE